MHVHLLCVWNPNVDEPALSNHDQTGNTCSLFRSPQPLAAAQERADPSLRGRPNGYISHNASGARADRVPIDDVADDEIPQP
jgi:hypothetical protein